MAHGKAWTKEEILEMWPQAAGELRGFQRHLEARRAGITADQLGMALQLASVEFQRLQVLRVREILENMLLKENVDTWLNLPHQDLGNRTPQSVIDEGMADAVVTLLENALIGLPS